MLAAGAVVGLVGGLAAQVLIGHTLHGDVADLARVVFVLPVAVFVAWWLLVPGMSLQRGVAEGQAPDGAVDERIERIEAAFDAGSIPKFGRPDPAIVDADAQAMFRASVRRARATTPQDVEEYGVRRPGATAVATAPPVEVEAAGAPADADGDLEAEVDTQLG